MARDACMPDMTAASTQPALMPLRGEDVVRSHAFRNVLIDSGSRRSSICRVREDFPRELAQAFDDRVRL